MNKYKCLLEGVGDMVTITPRLIQMCTTYTVKRLGDGITTELYFETPATLSTVRGWFDDYNDLHVPKRTVNYASKYTGQSYYFG